MIGLTLSMAMLPARLAYLGLKWAVRRWRNHRRVARWRPMAVPAFPHQRPAAPLEAAPTQAVPAHPIAVPGKGAIIPLTRASEEEEAAARANASDPYAETFGHQDYLLASFHSREGDGFKLVFHFQLRKHRVRRTVWLDFTRLARRMGRDKAWAMRARLGQSQMRFAVDRPQQPWGRLELPEAWLVIESTRQQKARTFMLETLDAVNQMIDAGGIDLVSGRHQCLPPGDPRPSDAEGSLAPASVRRPAAGRSARAATATAEAAAVGPQAGAQAELPLAAASIAGTEGQGSGGNYPPTPARLPQPGEENAGLPAGVIPEHVCTGFLAGAGFTERTDATGRSYRIFYADVDVDGRISRQTGADLERALKDANAYVGMRVRLQHLGYVPVNGGRHRRKVWQATVLPG